ncbi:hypothetical protein L6452_20556 [Arctium lappa]|uniref:Uncharacterized protein n=1 Tax=Arctium lappa TaxID=4217 RepID=A0ACB9BAU6_ARCLA|nr:hypothetical protein L6452_20556 [Arctium lappa]
MLSSTSVLYYISIVKCFCSTTLYQTWVNFVYISGNMRTGLGSGFYLKNNLKGSTYQIQSLPPLGTPTLWASSPSREGPTYLGTSTTRNGSSSLPPNTIAHTMKRLRSHFQEFCVNIIKINITQNSHSSSHKHSSAVMEDKPS